MRKFYEDVTGEVWVNDHHKSDSKLVWPFKLKKAMMADYVSLFSLAFCFPLFYQYQSSPNGAGPYGVRHHRGDCWDAVRQRGVESGEAG